MKKVRGSLALAVSALPLSLVIALSGCSGNGLASKSSSRFLVNSEPEGATVYVLGQPVGETPLTLEQRSVFPLVYPPEQVNLYGKVELRHRGCETLQRPVSGRVLANGMLAKLKCKSVPAAQSEETGKSATSATKSTRQRLLELQALKDEALISEEEYQTQRQRILGEL
ncbi:MAG: PEGA domain-containing protein [Gammaproteobacteria bacterium]|nr:PEGA domain-containing protein [Gammaproteobacteria bacterium]